MCFLRSQSLHLPGVETGGREHLMPPEPSPLTEGSKSTLVMLPPAPSRVWLASRRPGGTGGTGEMRSLNLMKMRSYDEELGKSGAGKSLLI